MPIQSETTATVENARYRLDNGLHVGDVTVRDLIAEIDRLRNHDPIRPARSGVATDSTNFGERRTNAVNTRTEALSRLIAAEKMNLLDDPLGQKLPDDLWKQALSSALAVMVLVKRDGADV